MLPLLYSFSASKALEMPVLTFTAGEDHVLDARLVPVRVDREDSGEVVGQRQLEAAEFAIQLDGVRRDQVASTQDVDAGDAGQPGSESAIRCIQR